MTPGKLARRAKVTLRTIRYYEEMGILKPAAVSGRGQKSYDLCSLLTMQRVRMLKEAGMSLEEIAATLRALSLEPTSGKSRQQTHAVVLSEARRRIEQRVQELRKLEDALDFALRNKKSCDECNSSDCDGCAVLDTWTRFGFEPPA